MEVVVFENASQIEESVSSVEVSRVGRDRDRAARPTWDAATIDWRTVDRALRDIAKRRGALDAAEARWLREAERVQVWQPVGMVSALDYLERVLGYTPHAARERLRVARALAELPAIAEAFEAGALPFSAVRELTRVATADTDLEWRDAAVGKTVHEIEDAIAGRRPGELPTDPADPQVRRHAVRLDLAADTYARFRQACAALADEHGRHLDDDELVDAFCDAVLDRGAADAEPTGRAKFQIALTVCERCRRGWQHGSGAKLPVDAATVARAECDAQQLGSLDGDAPERAHQDIPPSVVRLVWHRDGGRCQTPGCRSARGLEIHHLRHRSDGGSHEPSNLTLRCGRCHRNHHLGKLRISGTAPDKIVTEWLVGPRRDVTAGHPASVPRALPAGNELLRDACAALVTMGWPSKVARGAVDAAASHVGRDAPLVELVRESLRRCPRANA